MVLVEQIIKDDLPDIIERLKAERFDLRSTECVIAAEGFDFEDYKGLLYEGFGSGMPRSGRFALRNLDTVPVAMIALSQPSPGSVQVFYMFQGIKKRYAWRV